MTNPEILIEKLPHGAILPTPTYATAGSAGMDLMAAIDVPLTLNPGTRTVVPNGFRMCLAQGFEAQIRPRSGLAVKHGIMAIQGTIDTDYRGEIKTILINVGDTDFTIEPGMRIAQMVIAPYTHITWHHVAHIDDVTERNESGFGSTGLKASGF